MLFPFHAKALPVTSGFSDFRFACYLQFLLYASAAIAAFSADKKVRFIAFLLSASLLLCLADFRW